MAVIPLSIQEGIVILLFAFFFFLAITGVFLFIAVIVFKISLKPQDQEEQDAQNRISRNQKENTTKAVETSNAGGQTLQDG